MNEFDLDFFRFLMFRQNCIRLTCDNIRVYLCVLVANIQLLMFQHSKIQNISSSEHLWNTPLSPDIRFHQYNGVSRKKLTKNSLTQTVIDIPKVVEYATKVLIARPSDTNLFTLWLKHWIYRSKRIFMSIRFILWCDV